MLNSKRGDKNISTSDDFLFLLAWQQSLKQKLQKNIFFKFQYQFLKLMQWNDLVSNCVGGSESWTRKMFLSLNESSFASRLVYTALLIIDSTTTTTTACNVTSYSMIMQNKQLARDRQAFLLWYFYAMNMKLFLFLFHFLMFYRVRQ